MSTSQPQVIKVDESISRIKVVDGDCLTYEADLTGNVALTAHETKIEIDLASRQISINGRTADSSQDDKTLTLTVREPTIVDILVSEGLPPEAAELLAQMLPQNARLGGMSVRVVSGRPFGSFADRRSIDELFDDMFGAPDRRRSRGPFGIGGIFGD